MTELILTTRPRPLTVGDRYFLNQLTGHYVCARCRRESVSADEFAEELTHSEDCETR